MTQLRCLSAEHGAMYPAECTVINHIRKTSGEKEGNGGVEVNNLNVF